MYTKKARGSSSYENKG
jgi:hypothetical protein